MPPKLRVIDAKLDERPVGLRLPFHYGAVTLRQGREALVRVIIELEDGTRAAGYTAELMAPKWFDKSPNLTNDDNVDQLLKSLHVAAQFYRDHRAYRPAFDLHADVAAAHNKACHALNLPALVASFGLALMDQAIVSALCNATGLGFDRLVQDNLIGLNSRLANDVDDRTIRAALAELKPAKSMRLRHTVGMADALMRYEVSDPVSDGLPESLNDAIVIYGLRAFKIKVSGNADRDIAHLERVASVIEQNTGDYLCTLDANEQFADPDALEQFVDALAARPKLKWLMSNLTFIEQPMPRATTMDIPLGALVERTAFAIDEADDHDDAFLQAKAVGYRGVSSKSCKGLYRALLNGVRAAVWNAELGRPHFFVSAEDLCTQPGLALQQDLALAAMLGCADVERNGHHFGDGKTGITSMSAQRLRTDFPELYHSRSDRLLLRIEDGNIDVRKTVSASAYGFQPAMTSNERRTA